MDEHADGAVGRVLIVDDDDASVECAALALTRVGYSVASARNGALGIEAVVTSKPEVVLFDFWMPVAGGREFLQGLREVARTRIGLIAMSGTPEVGSWCERVGVQGFLKKPFEMDALREAVDRARDYARQGSADRISVAPVSVPSSRTLRISKMALVVGREDLVRAVRAALRESERPVQVAAVPEIEDAIRALSSFSVNVVVICGEHAGDRDARERLATAALAQRLPVVEGSHAADLLRDIERALSAA